MGVESTHGTPSLSTDATRPRGNLGQELAAAPTRRASEWLRTETRVAHERAEAQVMRHLDVRSQDSYVHYLERSFGVYLPLEARLAASAAYCQHVADHAERRKLSWLRDDLRFYGRATHGLPVCAELPPVNNLHQLLGMAYVFEGATLGGRVLLRMLSFSPAPTPGFGATFLTGYGPRSASLWRTFQSVLDQCAVRPEQLEELRWGAISAFEVFEHWIDAP